MNKTIDKMADININEDSVFTLPENDVDDFEQMLNDFISSEFDEKIEEHQQNIDEIKEQEIILPSDIKSSSTTEYKSILDEHEFSLFRAYSNFMYSIDILCDNNNIKPLKKNIVEETLFPHFKRQTGYKISKDILSGWDILMTIFPTDMQTINPDSTDDELLDFAERCSDENLQLAIISYIETLIELEGCEIDYESRKIKYQRKQLEKRIYEEHQRRITRAKKYIAAIKEKRFPIDAERLINNYFRLSNKDPEGSFKALTTNPATFAPIDFSKMKDKFFGLIKVKPQDGIRINQKLGNFLKKLKA